jgi:hypothetical protein
MSEQKNFSEIVAHWRYAPDEWHNFVMDEKKEVGREIRQTLPKLFLYALAVILPISAFVFFLNDLESAAAVLLFIPVVGGFLLFCTGIHYLIKKSEQIRFESKTGEVQITLCCVNRNGVIFNWGFETKPCRLKTIKRLKHFGDNGIQFEFLEFICACRIAAPRGGFMMVDKKCRVPIPRGKEREADFVIQRLYKAKASFSESADGLLNLNSSTFVGEHDFTASTTCNKCGSSIEAVTHFKWKCKK